MSLSFGRYQLATNIIKMDAGRIRLMSIVLFLLLTMSAQAETARIVGMGAATCRQYLMDANRKTTAYRDYLFWAQGYMSGILISRPPGIDEKLELNPPTLGPRDQIKFLSQYCEKNQSSQFADAVEALYKRLRAIQ